MMPVAARNRAIKRVLVLEYGAGKVRVWGDRGSAYGWVHIEIAATAPADQRDDWPARIWRENETQRVWGLLAEAGLDAEIGSYDNLDYGAGRRIRIDFVPEE